jgi:hypothetical protein
LFKLEAELPQLTNSGRISLLMRIFLIVTVITTIFYLMTGLVYAEGGFEGALVIKPYPMHTVAFGGGEGGAWARRHPGQTLPWFLQEELMIISRFSWEEGGSPGWVTVYVLGYVATFLSWIVLAVIGAVRLIKVLASHLRVVSCISGIDFGVKRKAIHELTRTNTKTDDA